MNSVESVLVFLVVGLIAGWMAGVLVKGRGFGVFGDIVVGVIGAELGGWIFSRLGLSSYGFVGAVIMALVGAIVLLGIIKLVVNVSSHRGMPLVLSFLACSWSAQAATPTADNQDTVTTTRTVQTVSSGASTAAAPSVITEEVSVADFEGRIVEIDYARSQILVEESFSGRRHEVLVKSDTLNHYRVGDYVRIHPTHAVTIITLEEENPKDFEGGIIRVDIPRNQIVVLDTSGRERKVDMKEGMIGTYQVDDYVRVHLMADLKEAKTIETVRGVQKLEGTIVNVDLSRSMIVVRDSHGKDTNLVVRQGQIQRYSTGNRVQIFLLPNREQIQVIRVLR